MHEEYDLILLSLKNGESIDTAGLSANDIVLLSGIEGSATCFVTLPNKANPDIKLALCNLNLSPKENWIEKSGGLPKYIHEIACSLVEEQGFTVSRAIATAISRCKVWAAGGGNVKPDTQAKAAKAIAELKSKQAKAKAN